jgi:hypothetical protein
LKQCSVRIDALPDNEEDSTSSLEENKSVVQSNKRQIPSTCQFCKLFFCRKGEWSKHIKSSHKDLKLFWCKTCDNFFRSIDERREHVLKIHNYQCIYCNHEPFLCRKSLCLHVAAMHSAEMIQCTYNKGCGAFFKTLKDKQIHVSNVHQVKQLQCKFCPSVVSCLHVSTHMMRHHKDMKKCTLCTEYFKTMVEIDEHISQMHSLKCIYCGVIKLNNSCLSEHIRYSHHNVSVSCRVRNCFYFFHFKEEEERHFKEKHAELEKAKAFKCPHCNFKTVSRVRLNLHKEQHSSVAIKCNICKKSYKSANNLKRHKYNVHRALEKCVRCNIMVKNLAIHQKCMNC